MKETRNYHTPINYTDNTRYGGEIQYYDFETEYRNDHKESPIAKQIAYDMKFDEQCRRNIECRKRARKEK